MPADLPSQSISVGAIAQAGFTGPTGAIPATMPLAADGTPMSKVAQPLSLADVVATGTLTTAQPVSGSPVAGGTVVLVLGGGQSCWDVYLAGTFSAGTTVQFEATLDGASWFAVNMLQIGNVTASPGASIVGGAPLALRGIAAGLASVRVRASALAGGDSVTVTLRASAGGGLVRLEGASSGGATTSGAVNPSAGAEVALVTPPAALTAGADTLLTFASQVRHLRVQNKSATRIYIKRDAPASLGSEAVYENGGAYGDDIPCTVLHIYSTVATNVNGPTDNNIVVEGRL